MQTMMPTPASTDLVSPRFGTPRDLSRPSYGHEVGEVARRLGKPLMPWQQHVADVALEVDPETGELFYEEVVITVPRQSGKTTLILALMVWRCVVLARRLVPQTVTYLAQSGKMARKKLEREFFPILRGAKWLREVPHSRSRPVKPTEWKPSMNNGSEHVLFGTGSYLQIEAPTDKGSHGDVLDMPVIDEAFAHQDDLVEQAVDAATVTRRSPQQYVLSTAGNEKSVFLWRKVLAGRKSVGVASRTCYFEWSLPEDVAFDDPDEWAKYLPALGHTITVSRLLARLDKALRNPDEVDEDGYEPGIAGFRRGYLNQWVKTPQLGGDVVVSEISDDEWNAIGLEGRRVADSQIVGPVTIGVGVGHGGASASLVIAGRTPAGLLQVELVENNQGTWWVERRLMDLCESHHPLAVAWDHGGPARALSPDITRGARGQTTAPLNGREWSGACEAFRVAVTEKRLIHLDDLLFLDAVRGADRREVGAGFVWDLRGARADITPILAATAAVRSLEMVPPDAVSEPFFAYSK